MTRRPADRLPPASDSSSYDDIPDFGMLYDSVPAYAARGDVEFYLTTAASGRGPVLELGCGTGRVLLPIARAGVTVTGLERSAAMLERLRARLRDEADATRARVTLQQEDIRRFDLGATFALVTAPFRVFQHLVTIEDQLACLASVARHLEPGGRFVFDVFNPHFELMTSDRTAEREDTPELVLDDGRTLRRTARVRRVRWTRQTSEVELIYYLADRVGATPARHVQAFDMRWFLRAELIHLLARSGFRVEAIHGDFTGAPLTDESPEQVVVAERI